jgi:hypothetical protein
VNAGEEIFRSGSLVNCVEHGLENRVGDYCYRTPSRRIQGKY